MTSGPPPSIAQLTAESQVKVDASYSAKAWLTSAKSMKERAELAMRTEDHPNAFRQFMKYISIVEDVKKLPSFASFPADEYAKIRSEAYRDISKVEKLKEIIRKEYQDYLLKNAADQISPKATSATHKHSPSLSELARNKEKENDDMMQSVKNTTTPDRIQPEKLHDYFSRPNPPRILAIDVRPRQDYVRTHLAGARVVHIDSEWLKQDGVTTQDIQNRLAGFHAENFLKREKFELIVCYDGSSSTMNQSPALKRLVRALVTSDITIERRPAMIVGGWQAWQNTVRVTSLRAWNGRKFITSGDEDGLDPIVSNSRPGSAGINRSAQDYLRSMQGGQVPSQAPPPRPQRRPSIPPPANMSESILQSYYAAAPNVISEDGYSPTNDTVGFDTFHNFAALTHSSSEDSVHESRTPQNFYPSRPIAGSAHVPAVLQTSHLPASLTKPPPLPEKPSSDKYLDQIPAPSAPSVGQYEPYNQLSYKNGLPAAPPPLLPRPANLQQLPTTLSQTLPTPPKFTVPPPPLATPPPRPNVQKLGPPQPARRAPSPDPAGTRTITLPVTAIESPAWQNSSTLGMCGLKNLGNTCYMNSILQCLFATQPLFSYFVSGGFRKHLNTANPLSTSGSVATAFSGLVTSVAREQAGVAISPVSFKDKLAQHAVQFRGSDQHDSQEFLAFLLDALHEDLNQGVKVKNGRGLLLTSFPEWVKTNGSENDDDDDLIERLGDMFAAEYMWCKYLSRNDSMMVWWFQGQLRSQLQCTVCAKTSVTFNPFMYLSLPIPGDGKAVRLADCLNEFMKEEVLDEGDCWRCPNCKVPRRAKKKMSISRLPKILLVHLKRFSFHGPFRDKLDTYVDFPVRNLDLFPYLSSSLQQQLVSFYTQDRTPQPPAAATVSTHGSPKQRPIQIFDLYAVSNHYGKLNSGHYTAYTRQMSRKAWFQFDDSRVTELCSISGAQEDASVKTKAAYSLFYVTRSMAAP